MSEVDVVSSGDAQKESDELATRFYVELEFVQNLSNARFLHHLAQQGYLDDAQFLDYLRYLQYWKQPEYAQHLLFPQCLTFLDALLSRPHFRRELATAQFMEFVHQQQGLSWMMGSSWVEGSAPVCEQEPTNNNS